MLTKPKSPKNLNLNSKHINNSDTFKINDPKTWFKPNNNSNSKTLLNDISKLGSNTTKMPPPLKMTPEELEFYTEEFLYLYYIVLDNMTDVIFEEMKVSLENYTEYLPLKKELLSNMETYGNMPQSLLKKLFLQNLDFSLPNHTNPVTGTLLVPTHVHTADYPTILSPFITYNVVVSIHSTTLETYMLPSAKSLYKDFLLTSFQNYESLYGQKISDDLPKYVKVAQNIALLNWANPIKLFKAVEGTMQLNPISK